MTLETPGQPRLLWGFFCDYFLIDISGKHSYIGVFEQIAARAFPAEHKIMHVVWALQGRPGGQAHGLLTLWSPDNEIILSTDEAPVQFNEEGRALVVNALYGVRLPRPGRYTAVLELDRRPAGELPLTVIELRG